MKIADPIHFNTDTKRISPADTGDNSCLPLGKARAMRRFVGTSVCGPAHIDLNVPCQDAWMLGRYSFGEVLVVSDGMGSRPHADIGAKAACRAVLHAAKLWGMHPEAPPTNMIKLTHHIWRLLIHPYPQEDCVATCIFAILLARGKMFAAQLGDGLFYLKTCDSSYCLSEGRDADFTNETIGLGLTTSLSDWHFAEMSLPTSFNMMLCTDGVADDILPDRRADFVGYLREELDPLSPRQRVSLLRRELNNWPTPGHNDDKTLVLAWQKEKASE